MTDQSIIKQNSDLIWTIANLLRGPYRPPQYRRVMIPLTVLRRLDCVLEPTKKAVLTEHRKLKADGKYDDATIEKMICRKFKLNFFNSSGFTFAHKEEGLYASLLADADNLPANFRAFMAGFSIGARKILGKFKFEEEIEKLDESNRLFDIVKQFANVDLHPGRVENAAMGYLFEDLVRRFNEQANEEAGDHFTPREVINLMVSLLFTNEEIIIFGNQEFGYLKITGERPLRLNFAATGERFAKFKESAYYTGLVESKKRKAVDAKAKEIAEGREKQKQILSVLEKLKTPGSETIKDRAVFEAILEKAFKKSPVKLDAPLKKALLAPGALGERDPEAEICRDSKGNPEPDPELRDTENVTRHFYKYTPPRPLTEIEADIQGLEKDIVRMLAEVTA